MANNPYASPDSPEVLPAKKPRSRLVMVFVVGGILAVMLALFLPSVRRGGTLGAAGRIHSMNNVKNITLALHNYESRYHALPPAFTVDADGKPLHSWRTMILPYLDEKALYETIDLSKPWDDPVNAVARQATIMVYRSPVADLQPQHTTYLAIVTPDSCLRSREPRLFSDLIDPLSDTVMVMEVNATQSVEWMSPQDADESMVLAFGVGTQSAHKGGTPVGMVDGSVTFLSSELTAAQRLALISIAGGDSPGEF